LAAGVTVTVRLPALPPNTMLFVGTRFVLEEALVSASRPADVSASPMVKEIGPVVPSSGMVWLPMAVIVGGLLAVNELRRETCD